MKKFNSLKLFPLLGCYLLIIGVFLFELIKILQLNEGLFVYTLDDAYIHLALAENIIHGHYGVNLGEFSAPVSSILWPLLLAPLSQYEVTPLFINIAAAIGTIYFFYLFLWDSIQINSKKFKPLVVFILLLGMTVSANMIGLIFMGMEHTLQLLVGAVIAWGLLVYIQSSKIRNWLLVAIFIAPLIRYENLALTIAASMFLVLNGNFKKVIKVPALIALTLAGFSLYLVWNDSLILPSSVIAKATMGGRLNLLSLLSNPLHNLFSYIGISYGIWALILLIYTVRNVHSRQKRLLVWVSLLAFVLHLMAGRISDLRYEVYVISFLMLVSIYVYSEPIAKFLDHPRPLGRIAVFSVIMSLLFILINLPYFLRMPVWYIGSNNIYCQQYQMHRFVTDYYSAPVAVNDLGYVSYKNDHYVLDLYGLSSPDALRYRMSETNGQWMDMLTLEKNVKLVMIYEKWFDDIPDTWYKIGDLVLIGNLSTLFDAKVAFYITDPAARPQIESALDDFIPTLPENTVFVFSP